MAQYYNQNVYGQTQVPYGYQYPYTTGGFTTPGVAGPPYPPVTPGTLGMPGMLPVEESYIENILRLNKGKIATVYMSFENKAEWSAKVFRGVIEAAGRDHIILSDLQTGMRYLLLMIYLDYVTFDEELNYEYPYAAGTANLGAYSPR